MNNVYNHKETLMKYQALQEAERLVCNKAVDLKTAQKELDIAIVEYEDVLEEYHSSHC